MQEAAAQDISLTSSVVNEQVISELGLRDEMTRLRVTIKDWLSTCGEEMQLALHWQFGSNSKYFRPATVFSCYRACSGTTDAEQIPDQIMTSALAIEIFHNMSLIIDDILDQSRFRRSKLTLHARFGELQALMTAGYITADGFDLLRNDPDGIRLCAELVKRLGEAECLQWRLRKRPLGTEDWRRIAGEDTGSMFEICACLGDRSEGLRKFGHLLGVLYHGCDDVADVRGSVALGGGGVEDIRDGILTLPASLAVRDPAIAEMFLDPNESNFSKLGDAFRAKLVDAERYLDQVAFEACEEARANAADPSSLIALVDQTRLLSGR